MTDVFPFSSPSVSTHPSKLHFLILKGHCVRRREKDISQSFIVINSSGLLMPSGISLGHFSKLPSHLYCCGCLICSSLNVGKLISLSAGWDFLLSPRNPAVFTASLHSGLIVSPSVCCSLGRV